MIKKIIKKTFLYLPLKKCFQFCKKRFISLQRIFIDIRYERNIKSIRNNSKKRKINIAFLTMYSTSNQCFSLFELMLKSDCFSPKIVINPDVLRGTTHLVHIYNQTKLINKFKMNDDSLTKKFTKNLIFLF